MWLPSQPTKHGNTPKGPARVGAVCPESRDRPVMPQGPATWCDDWPRPEGASDPHQGRHEVSNISRSAVGHAMSGHAQSRDTGTGQRGSATPPISGESRHWQEASNSDNERTKPAVANADGVVRGRKCTSQR